MQERSDSRPSYLARGCNRGILLVAAALGLCASSCAGPTTTPTSPSVPAAQVSGNAPVLRLNILVDGTGATDAIASLSDVFIEATASGGSGSFTYSIDFGDGVVATTGAAHHTYASPGSFTVTCIVTDSVGRKTTESSQLPVRSVTGSWFQAGYVQKTRRVEVRRLTITAQEGLTIRGTYRVTGAADRTFSGTLVQPRNGRIVMSDGATLDGALPARLEDAAEKWVLAARGDTLDGQRLEFRPIVGEPTAPAPDAVMKLSFDDAGPNAWAPYAALTPVHIDGLSSRGDGLTYFLEYGDGFVTAAAQGEHVVDAPSFPLLTARLTIVDRFGRSDAESASYQSFELGFDRRDRQLGDYWVSYSVNGPALYLVFTGRNALQYVGEVEQRGGFARTTAYATLSSGNTIRISLPAIGVEYSGTIQMSSPPQGFTVMTLVQSGGANHGDIWRLYLNSFY